jgi:hypothetical protein
MMNGKVALPLVAAAAVSLAAVLASGASCGQGGGQTPTATVAPPTVAPPTVTPTPAATLTTTPAVTPEASPTPPPTSTGPPTELDWERAEQSAMEDNAKPRFRGEMGDFVIVEPNSGPGYPCPEPGPATNLEQSELYFDLPGLEIDSIGTGACQGTIVSIQAGVPGELGGATVGRGYFLSLPLEESFDAPAERLKLMTVAGKPAIAMLPIPDCIACVTNIAVIERFPTEAAPGITAWVHTLQSLDKAIALLEQMMAGGKE